jgi:Phytanoyl-CoA dioxygenase (PhyH)
MTVIYFDAEMSDDERRQKVFAGDLFVYSPTPHSLELRAFARQLAEEALSPHFPPDAQHHMEKQEYVDVLAKLKPTFINHPRSKELVAGILADLGVDLDEAYLDVPRLRTMTSNYLNAGLTLQFESHRDTWFSAPFSQINYWIPVYDVAETNAMAFHPRYFTEAVRNSSRDYNYAQWVAQGRAAAAEQVEKETRKQPEAQQEIEREPDIRVITPPGGILIFSGAQLHTTVPNTSGKTRFSIDFRVVNRRDVEAHAGAANVDSECTGTNLGDFLRAADLERLPTELIQAYDTAPA